MGSGTAVILCSGSIMDYNRCTMYLRDNPYIICADGGADHMLEFYRISGVLPDILLGDFDSVSKDAYEFFLSKGVNKLKYPEKKDMTDSHIAVEYAINLGFEYIRLLGATGTRLDHSLGNIMMMKKYYSQGINFLMADGNYEACIFGITGIASNTVVGTASDTAVGIVSATLLPRLHQSYLPTASDTAVGILSETATGIESDMTSKVLPGISACPSKNKLSAKPSFSERNSIFLTYIDDTGFSILQAYIEEKMKLSLIPVTDEVSGIFTEGVTYPLYNASIKCGDSIGISNCFTENSATVKVKNGIMLAVAVPDNL